MTMRKKFKPRGRPKAPGEAEYINSLYHKKRTLTINLYPAYTEDRELVEWIEYISEREGVAISTYLRHLLEDDRKKRWPEEEKRITKKEALLEEMS